jgi:acyl-CoA thioester hydrolase
MNEDTAAPLLLHMMQFPVRWGELDVLGHVNNAQYLRYFEESRTAWCEVIGRPLRNTGEGMILLKASVTYQKPIGYPANVRVDLHAGRVGNSSFTLINTLMLEGETEPACTGEFIIVWFDYIKNESKRVPNEIRALLGAA